MMVLRLIAVDHPDTDAYPEEFIANARAVASLAQVSWKSITVERIQRAVDRISKSKSFTLIIIIIIFSLHLSA